MSCCCLSSLNMCTFSSFWDGLQYLKCRICPLASVVLHIGGYVLYYTASIYFHWHRDMLYSWDGSSN